MSPQWIRALGGSAAEQTATQRPSMALSTHLASARFADLEPVLQSHPLVAGVPVPVFGDRVSWPLSATKRPANLAPSKWTVKLSGLDRVWNLRAREVAMALFNPEHPAVLAAGVDLGARPAEVGTVRSVLLWMSVLVEWAAKHGLPQSLREWQDDDGRGFIEHRRAEVVPGSLVHHVQMVKLLHRFGPLLTGGGLAADPWPAQSSRQVAHDKNKTVKTANIAPQVWFALVRAAWTYVHEFGPDIIAARRRYAELLERAQPGAGAPVAERLAAFLADPGSRIPLHNGRFGYRRGCEAGTANLGLLALLLGFETGSRVLNRGGRTTGPQRRYLAMIDAAVAAGRGVAGGLVERCATVTRPDGSSGPWHPGLCPSTLPIESVVLRAAAYIVVAALSMMRDSEIVEIIRGSVAEHYGAPAVASTKRKHDPNRPRERWWIIEPVAEAIAVAEAVSAHPERVFASDPRTAEQQEVGFNSRRMVQLFIEHVNAHTVQHGLHIPRGKVSPHMFRKTMAMLTATEPGAEIALGIQLKHLAVRALANRSTQGYAATDTHWAKLLDTAIDQARFTRLKEFYDDYHAGQKIGFGPGADKLAAAFDAVKETAEHLTATGQARQGDARVEYDLLRRARISIRFGKLNHCTADERNPVGAKCLEGDVTVPKGHQGPLIDRCQPGRCANSVIGPEHLPIWQAEETSLLKLRQHGKLPPARRALLDRQLQEVQAVMDRAEGKNKP